METLQSAIFIAEIIFYVGMFALTVKIVLLVIDFVSQAKSIDKGTKINRNKRPRRKTHFNFH